MLIRKANGSHDLSVVRGRFIVRNIKIEQVSELKSLTRRGFFSGSCRIRMTGFETGSFC
jgi:hypothetical protein